MEIIKAKTADLIPYGFNNRIHSDQQVDRIANSINQFGFNQPIVVDENNIILVGHGRFEAAKKLNLDEVPVVKKTNLTDTEKKAYRILDNKLQNDSTWNTESLEIELAALEEAGFDLEVFGLSDLSKLFPEEQNVDDDNFDVRESCTTMIKTGDVIELGDHRVMCGDSTDPNFVVRLMDGQRPEMMVTDPPYGVEYDAGWRNEVKRPDGSSYGAAAIGTVTNDHRFDWRDAWKHFKGAVAYVWHDGNRSPEIAESLNAYNFVTRNLIIWAKNIMVISRGDYHHQHEPCLYMVRKGESAQRTEDRTQSTLWQIDKPSRSDTGHSTQKPIECMGRPIKNHTFKLIYDPFLGSGTTLIAADQLSRKCFGMEINPDYCQVIVDRYKAHCEKAGKPFVCKLNGEDVSAYISTPDQLADADKLIGS